MEILHFVQKRSSPPEGAKGNDNKAVVISSECEKSQKNIKYYGKYSSVLGVHYVK